MTANQIKYWDLQRQKTADAEVARSNQAREQYQLAQLEEQKRSNLAREIETARANFAAESERARANRANELLTSQGLSIQRGQLGVALTNAKNLREYQQAQVAHLKDQLTENTRHNKQEENIKQFATAQNNLLTTYGLEETKRHNLAMESAQKYSTTAGLLGSLANTVGRSLASFKGNKK